jgi:hypothetical protein
MAKTINVLWAAQFEVDGGGGKVLGTPGGIDGFSHSARTAQ